ncbi:MAG TPA: hypothetical protein VGG72_22065 [Bryobacteraceae bacterium]
MRTEALAAGQWLLMGIAHNAGDAPVHGVKFKFHDEPSGLRGAIVNWETGGEIPLARLRFDGSVLEIQMTPDDDYEGEDATLTMKLEGKQFEGYWMNESGEKLLDRKLKLVQSQQLA